MPLPSSILVYSYVVRSLPENYQVLWIDEYVCLSVFPHDSKTTQPIFPKFFCACCLWPWLGTLLTALRYVMYFRLCGWRFYRMGPMGHNQARRYISMKFARWQHQLDARQLVLGRVHQNAAPGAKCAICDCLVILKNAFLTFPTCFVERLYQPTSAEP